MSTTYCTTFTANTAKTDLAPILETLSQYDDYTARCIEFLSQRKFYDENDEDENDDDENTKYIPSDSFQFTKINNGVPTPIENLTPEEIRKLALYVRACDLLDERLEVLNILKQHENDGDSSTYFDTSDNGLNRFYDAVYQEDDDDDDEDDEDDDEDTRSQCLSVSSSELLRYLNMYSTYGELFESQFYHPLTEKRYFGKLTDCNGDDYSLGKCCYKSYGWHLVDIYEVDRTIDTLDMRNLLDHINF